MAAQGMDYWLARKYALLQQQANAGTQNAQSTATAAEASARLDRTRSALMPAESAVNMEQIRAQARLLREQAGIVKPESIARIANLRAETAHIGTQDRVLQREGLMERMIDEEAVERAQQRRLFGNRVPTLADYAGYGR